MFNDEHFDLSVLLLFNGVCIDKNKVDICSQNDQLELLKYGIILSPDVIQYGNTNVKKMMNDLINLGYNCDYMNSSFHKSMHTVKNIDKNKHYYQQMLHYFSTYGADLYGVYDDKNIIIPQEILDIPHDDTNVKLLVIHGLEKNDIIDKVKTLISGVALSNKTLDLISNVIAKYNLLNTEQEINKTKNKELKVLLYRNYNLVPSNETDFLRFIIYIASYKSLLIKNKDTIKLIKFNIREVNNISDDVNKMFNIYIHKYGIEHLASIFYRYKDLWLAFKNAGNASVINRMRKLADKYHKPCQPRALDLITSKKVSINDVKKELKNVTIFKKISLINMLMNHMHNHDSSCYKIRNGKIFVKDINQKKPVNNEILIMNVICQDVVKQINENVKGKTFYIPKNISYKCPTSEKKFMGNIPFGTSINLNDRCSVGIHWFNDDKSYIDLDLHVMNDKRNVGWDVDFTSNDSVMFSGDMTSAPKPNGASEITYFGKHFVDESIFVSVNNFNGDDDDVVDVKFFIDEHDSAIENDELQKYISSKLSVKLMTDFQLIGTNQSLGILSSDSDGKKTFYFSQYRIDNNRSISDSKPEIIQKLTSSLLNEYENSLSLKDLLLMCEDVNIISDESLIDENVINLSLSNIDKEIILSLFA